MNTSTISASSSTDSFSELIHNLENNEITISDNRGLCQKIYDKIYELIIQPFKTKYKTQ